MNKKNFQKALLKIFSMTGFVLIISFVVRENFNEILLLDEASVGWYWGVFGTLYALITTFILVTVWGQFQNFEKTLSIEAESLTSTWNYTDYLNDTKVSSKMKKALLSYSTYVLDEEIVKLKNGEIVPPDSKELKSISKVIDKISFDDDRDPEAFRALMRSYKALVESRKTRIDLSTVRIPPHLRVFFSTVSIAFIFGYVLHGFNSSVLYYLTLAVLTIVVYMSDLIIHDFDNYFTGIWNVSFKTLRDARNFIKTDKHS